MSHDGGKAMMPGKFDSEMKVVVNDNLQSAAAADYFGCSIQNRQTPDTVPFFSRSSHSVCPYRLF